MLADLGKEVVRVPGGAHFSGQGDALPCGPYLLAGSGYDWMNIDMEHSPNDLHSVLAQLQAIAPYEVEPVVRLVRFDKDLVKQYLDLGVRTLMLPNIDSVDQAQAIVQATRYAPRGVRGVAGQQRANRWGRVKGYHANAEQQLCIVVQIESPAGVAQAGAIAAVDGIDALFVGPNDLAAAMGHMGNPSEPSVQAAIAEVQAKVTQAGKPTGILAVVEADAQRYIAQGYRSGSSAQRFSYCSSILYQFKGFLLERAFNIFY